MVIVGNSESAQAIVATIAAAIRQTVTRCVSAYSRKLSSRIIFQHPGRAVAQGRRLLSYRGLSDRKTHLWYCCPVGISPSWGVLPPGPGATDRLALDQPAHHHRSGPTAHRGPLAPPALSQTLPFRAPGPDLSQPATRRRLRRRRPLL